VGRRDKLLPVLRADNDHGGVRVARRLDTRGCLPIVQARRVHDERNVGGSDVQQGLRRRLPAGGGGRRRARDPRARQPLAGRTMKGCARGYEMPRVVYAPDRILKPLLRTGPRGSGQFREAGWPEALEVVARGLAEVQSRFGAGSILALAGFGSGRGTLHSTQRLTKRFLALLGGYTEITGGYSSAAADFVTPTVLGTNWPGSMPPRSGTLGSSSCGAPT